MADIPVEGKTIITGLTENRKRARSRKCGFGRRKINHGDSIREVHADSNLGTVRKQGPATSCAALFGDLMPA